MEQHNSAVRSAFRQVLVCGLTFFVAFSFTGEAFSQSENSATDSQGRQPAFLSEVESFREPVLAILKASLAEGEAYTKLIDLCTKAPHRLSGSEGADRAVAWAQQQMEADGLENVHLEPVIVPHWERGLTCRVTVANFRARGGEDLAAIALGGSIATPEGGITAEVMEVHSFEALKERADEARGKIVFFNRPMDPSLFDSGAAYGGAVNQRTQGAVEAARVGAVATLVRSMTTSLDDFPHTGAMRYTEGVPRIPSAAVSTLAAERLSTWLAQGPVTLRMEQDCRWLEDKLSHNVIGELVGREKPDEILVVGGHLDGWDVGQGAHDDGSGCCQSIEVVRLLKSLGLRPRRTIRVVMFMNEENGLAGGRAYHQDHRDEMSRHLFALESDRGGFSPEGFSVQADPQTLAIIKAIGGLMEPAHCGKVTAGGGGADVSPMAQDGVVVASLVTDSARYFDLHHSNRDTLEQVSERELNLGAGAMAALLYVLAEREDTLPHNSSKDGG